MTQNSELTSVFLFDVSKPGAKGLLPSIVVKLDGTPFAYTQVGCLTPKACKFFNSKIVKVSFSVAWHGTLGCYNDHSKCNVDFTGTESLRV